MAPDLPNILLIMTDQQKATASSLYGNPFCETPSMARLANEGVLFEQAYTPHPLCVPARVSLWTSQYPHTHGARRNQTFMPQDAVHAFRLWREAGYHNALIGKNHCFDLPRDLGLFQTWCELSHGGLARGVEARGMPWYRPEAGIRSAHEARRTLAPQNPRFGYAVSDAPLEDQSTGLIAGQTVRFLEQHRNEPFALWVSFPDPHEPWVAPAQYAATFPPERIVVPPCAKGEFDQRAPERNRVLYRMLGVRDDPEWQLRELMGVYHAMVRFVDDGVGQILDALESLDLRKETIVVFCSDHGDMMGEHGMQCKGGVFYDCLTRVPLIVSWPGTVAPGHRESSMVNLVDIVPTLLRLQGIEVPRSMQGAGLPGVIDAQPRSAAFSEYGAGGPPFRMADLLRLPEPYGRRTLIQSLQWREAEGRRKMVRTRDWKYVHDPMGDLDELYDLRRDPGELSNVAAETENREMVDALRLRMLDWSVRTEDASPVPLPEL
jgi:choline-sulfatase